jgi:ankyrin repeat protein
MAQFWKEQKMSDIFKAVANKAYAEIIKAKEEGQDINGVNGEGKTPLLLAIENQDDSCVGILLQLGANPNRGSNNKTPLSLAVEKENMKIIEVLLERGCDVNLVNENGETVLFSAIRTGKDRLVSLLLQKEAKINVVDANGKTLLLLAIEKENTQFLKLLLEKGTDVNQQDKEGSTPLFLAVEKGNEAIVETLLSCGAKVNIALENSKSPLIKAIEGENKKLPHLLLQAGADVNVQDKEGRTPLLLAIEKENEDLISLLVEKGADVNYKWQDKSLTDIAFNKGQYSVVTMLIKRGAPLSGYSLVSATEKIIEKAKFGRRLKSSQDYQIVTRLMKEGIGLDLTGEDGKGILHLLVENYDEKIANLLNMALQKGANPNIQDKNGRAPLHYLALTPNLELSRLLIAYGANVNQQDKNGATPRDIMSMLSSMRVYLTAGKGNLNNVFFQEGEEKKSYKKIDEDKEREEEQDSFPLQVSG